MDSVTSINGISKTDLKRYMDLFLKSGFSQTEALESLAKVISMRTYEYLASIYVEYDSNGQLVKNGDWAYIRTTGIFGNYGDIYATPQHLYSKLYKTGKLFSYTDLQVLLDRCTASDITAKSSLEALYLQSTAWASSFAQDAFLLLDRNNDGVINDGGKLFGDQTLLSSGKYAKTGFET